MAFLHLTIRRLLPLVFGFFCFSAFAFANTSSADRFLAFREALQAYLETETPGWYVPIEPSEASVADIEQVLLKKQAANEVEGYLNYALNLIIRHDLDPEMFTRYLWNAAWYLKERTRQTQLLEFILRYSSRLPLKGEKAAEMLNLHAGYLLETGQPEAAQQLFAELAQDVAASPDQRMDAAGRMGLLAEESGDLEAALAAYQQLADAAEDAARVPDYILRGIFAALELKRYDDALTLVEKLELVDPIYLLESPFSAQLMPMVEKGPYPDFIQNYWSHSEKWWPQWLELAPQLGIDLSQAQLPMIENYSRLLALLQQAARTGQRDAFFQAYHQLLSASRWLPKDAVISTEIHNLAAQLAPEFEVALAEVLVAQHEGLPLALEEHRKMSGVILAAAYFDSGQFEKLLEYCPQYLDEFSAFDGAGQKISRLWALAASRFPERAEGPIRNLRNVLNNAEVGKDRALTVGILAELLEKTGSTADQIALLEKQLEHPDIRLDAQRARLLAQRLRSLRTLQLIDAEVNAFFAGWYHRFAPEWLPLNQLPEYDLASAPDPAAAFEALFNSLSRFQGIQLQLEVALNKELPLDLRLTQFIQAVQSIHGEMIWREDLLGSTQYILDAAQLTDFAKSQILWHAAYVLAFNGQVEAVQHLLKQPPAKALAPFHRTAIEESLAFAQAPKETRDQLEDLFFFITREPLSPLNLPNLRRLLRIAVLRGEIDLAERFYDATAVLNVESGNGMVLEDVRSNLREVLDSTLESIQPYLAKRALLFEFFPPDSIAPPPAASRLLKPANLAVLPREQAFQQLLNVIKTGDDGGEFLNSPFELLFDYIEISYREQPFFNDRLLEAGILAATSDLERAEQIHLALSLDLDDPVVCNRFFAAVEPWRLTPTVASALGTDAPYASESDAAIDYIAALADWRTGNITDARQRFERLLAQPNEQLDLDRAVQFFDMNGTDEELAAVLARLSVEDLGSPGYVYATLPALKRLGREEEWKQARESVLQIIESAQLTAIATVNGSFATGVLWLCYALDEPAFDPQWADVMQGRLADQERFHQFRLLRAFVTHDWKTAEAAGSAVTSIMPTVYDTYYFYGYAAYKNGDWTVARGALQIFVEHCHDNPKYAEALQLLSEIDGTAEVNP